MDEDQIITPEDLEEPKSDSEEVSKKKSVDFKSNFGRAFEYLLKAFGIFKILFLKVLHLEGIDDKLPQSWQEKLPDNRMKMTLPVVIVLGGFCMFLMMIALAPSPAKKNVNRRLPVVQIQTVSLETLRIPVFSQGIVTPTKEIQMVSVVNGPVTYVAPNMVDGGVVKKGQLLLKISDRSYQQDKSKVEAQRAQVVSAQIAKKGELRIRGTLRTTAGKAQLNEVNAAVAAADANLQSMNDLIAKTEIRAPFDGLLRNTNIKHGQMLSSGTLIGSVFGPEKAEVRLPLSDKQLSLIDVPFYFENAQEQSEEVKEESDTSEMVKNESARQTEALDVSIAGEAKKAVTSKVVFTANFGEDQFKWYGKVIRTAGGRSELNRLQYLISEVDKPFGRDEAQANRPPLSPGFFVEANIEGKAFDNIVILPRKAYRTNRRVWLVDNENRLVSKEVELLYRGKKGVYLKGGLQTGDQVVVSDMRVFLEGAEVKVLNPTKKPASELPKEKKSKIKALKEKVMNKVESIKNKSADKK